MRWDNGRKLRAERSKSRQESGEQAGRRQQQRQAGSGVVGSNRSYWRERDVEGLAGEVDRRMLFRCNCCIHMLGVLSP